ncbi:hypothetical protein LPJ76_001378 [Coemansia sp. RSA 638]|nr:hypothetical protein LPJ76_001378 [Coemansia sp. RSA 638]
MGGRTFRQRRQRQRQQELAPKVKGRPSQDKEWVALREWCTVQVSSQSNSAVFQPISDHDSIALAPMLDLLNHSCQARVSTYFDTGRRLFVIKTLRRYCKGEEAFISYGPHDNGFMLAEYGFALAENPHCALELDCEVEAWVSTVKANLNTRGTRATIKSTDVDMLVDVLKQHGLWGDFTLFSGSTELPYRLQAAMYLIFAAIKPGAGIKGVVSQWERWQRGENTSISEEVDLAVKNWVSRTCGEVAERSSKLLCNIQAKQNDDARGSECLDPFLVHSLRVIWTTINITATESTSQ